MTATPDQVAVLPAPPTAPAGRRQARGKAESSPFVGLPQVNLLPPEVRAARGLRVVRRWLGVALVAFVLLLVAAFVLSLLARAAAQDELADAMSEQSRLQAEAAKYAEVPLVLNAIDQTTAARAMGMSTEILWPGYLGAITAVLPAASGLESLTYFGDTPMVAAPPPVGPLDGPSVGRLDFEARTLTLPDSAAMIDALNSIPAFTDAWVSSATIEEQDGTTYYRVSASVLVTDGARALRFAQADEEN